MSCKSNAGGVGGILDRLHAHRAPRHDRDHRDARGDHRARTVRQRRRGTEECGAKPDPDHRARARRYRIDNDDYPTTDQGLQSLRSFPVTGTAPPNWKGPYLRQVLPLDPWGTDLCVCVAGCGESEWL